MKIIKIQEVMKNKHNTVTSDISKWNIKKHEETDKIRYVIYEC